MALETDIVTCGLCKETFKKREDFLKHVPSCDASKEVFNFCKSSYKNKKLLSDPSIQLINGEVKDSFIYCKYCDKNSTYKVHSDEKRITCTSCGNFLTDYKSLCEDILAQSDNDSFICCLCLQDFKEVEKLKDHYSAHCGIKINYCELCDKTFATNSTLKRHKLTHINDESKFKCDICNKNFKRADYLKDHYSLHSNEKPFNCDLCDKNFRLRANFRKHRQSHFIERQIYCSYCRKLYSDHVPDNEAISNKKNCFICCLCQQAFIHVVELQAHYLIHSSKPFTCKICSTTFTIRSSLKRHMMRHMGVKKHICDICQKSFIRSDSLKEHYLSHTGDKPFKCDFCDKCFQVKTALNRHERRHNKMKYICEICNNIYDNLRDLKIHECRDSKMLTDKPLVINVKNEIL